MTDTVNRPGTRDAGSTRSASASSQAVVLPALVATGACLLSGLVTCSVVAVIGWLAATFGGASGAMRAGASMWLAAHKTGVTVGSASITLAPLGLTLLLGYFLYRAGRFATRMSGAQESRELLTLSGVLAGAYGVGALLVAVLTSSGSVKISPFSALLGAVTLAAFAGTLGVMTESGALMMAAKATPHWVRQMIAGALAAAATVLTAATVLYAVMLVLHFSRVTSMLEALDSGVVGSIVLFGICLVLLPNAIVYAAAFIAGPGFQLGVGTTVAPTGVDVGSLPSLPLLAAVPADGATPTYMLFLTGLVPLLAGVAAGLVVARRVSGGPDGDLIGWDAYAVRAAFSGPLTGLVLLVLFVLAGGSAGPGRMASFGVPGALAAAGVVAAGVTIGAAITAAIVGARRAP
ncbi:cell division protein PerM [Kribbella deserti]|uniref:DUF6350 family protein n=1 Tax=Kribbella deserti TaxID=1926257 RepID=A0ABV6QGK4_9ACTN